MAATTAAKFFVAFRKRHRSLGLHFKAALLARPRRRLDDDVVERMALTAALELEPIDDRAGKPEGLRLREHGKRIVGCDFCLKLRTCRSRRSRAGVLLWFSSSRHLLAQMIKAIRRGIITISTVAPNSRCSLPSCQDDIRHLELPAKRAFYWSEGWSPNWAAADA